MRESMMLRLSLLLALIFVLGACQPMATQPAAPQAAATQPPATQAPTEQPAVTEAPAAGEAATLTVWDQFYRGAESDVMDTLNAEFEADHPGATINRDAKVLEDLSTTVKLALSEQDGPDVSQVNQGRGDMGALVQGDLLLPLDDYADQYGWGERLSESIQRRNRFTADGQTFGEGNLYGVSPTAEVVGVYYNKDKFDENGWSIPTTFDEFQQLLADIAATGATPITFGNLDGWPGIHEFSSVEHVFADPEWVNNFVYGLNDVSFETDTNVHAAEIMQQWVDNGYFTEGFEGIGYDDSVALFKSGDGVLMITGSWLSGELADSDYNFGFFLMPQESADDPQLAVGGVGIPFAVRRTTDQPDLAAEYLDWMISPRAAELWAEADFVPAMPLPEDAAVEEGSMLADTIAAWNRINADNGVGHYLDWATPTMYDTLVAELQKLFAEQTTPEEFVANVQADYADFLASQP